MASPQHHYAALVNRLEVFARRKGSPAAEDAAAEALTRTLRHPGAGPALRSYLDDTLPLAASNGDWAPDNLFAWLYRVVENVVREQRRAGRREVPLLHGGWEDPLDRTGDSLSRLIDEESIAVLNECLATLDPDVRAALTLRLKKQRSYAEIAAAMQQTPNTIATWIHRGCKEMARRFHARIASSEESRS